MDLASKPCITCRKRKVKCDKGSPCSNCVRRRIPCSYDESGPDGEAAGGDDGNVEVLQRLTRIEALLVDLTASRPGDQTPNQDSGSDDIDLADAPDLYNGAQTADDSVEAALTSPHQLNDLEDEIPGKLSVTSSRLRHTSTAKSQFPSPEQLDLLFTLFSDLTEPFIKLLDVETHLYKLRNEQNLKDEIRYPAAFRTLDDVILALALVTLPSRSFAEDVFEEPYDHMLEILRGRAERMLSSHLYDMISDPQNQDGGTVIEYDDLHHIHALLYHTTFLLEVGESAKAHTYLCMSFSLALRLNLHRDPLRHPSLIETSTLRESLVKPLALDPSSSWYHDVRRRTWHYLCHLDLRCHEESGVDFLIPPNEQWYTDFPMNVNDSTWPTSGPDGRSSRHLKPLQELQASVGFTTATYLIVIAMIGRLRRILEASPSSFSSNTTTAIAVTTPSPVSKIDDLIRTIHSTILPLNPSYFPGIATNTTSFSSRDIAPAAPPSKAPSHLQTFTTILISNRLLKLHLTHTARHPATSRSDAISIADRFARTLQDMNAICPNMDRDTVARMGLGLAALGAGGAEGTRNGDGRQGEVPGGGERWRWVLPRQFKDAT